MMDDQTETKYQNVIQRLQNDLLAAEMRNQFYAETLAKMTLTEHRLREALHNILQKDYVVDCKDVAHAALKEMN